MKGKQNQTMSRSYIGDKWKWKHENAHHNHHQYSIVNRDTKLMLKSFVTFK